MIDQLISFETAELAKEKGFPQLEDDEPGIKYSRGGRFTYRVVTQSLLQKWLREVHNLHIYIDTTPTFDKMQGSKYKASIKQPFQPFKWTTGHYYLGNTYEEALEQGLIEALKLIK